MPAFATHYIFALSLEEQLPSLSQDETFSFSKAAYYYGTQGPDFLFSHRVWRNVTGGLCLRELGSELHSCNISKMIALMKDYLENEPCDRDIVRSFIYGYICHYALDRNCHPLVYAIQEELTRAHQLEANIPFSVHNQIEMNIDAALLKSELGYANSLDFKNYMVLENNEFLIDEMAGLMAWTVPQVMFCEAKKDDFKVAFRDMIMGQRALSDRTGARRMVVRAVQAPLKKFIGGPLLSEMIRQKKNDGRWDYMNLRHTQWTKIYDRSYKSDKDFMQLYHEAQADAVELIKAFETDDTENNFRNICGDMSFDTGVKYTVKPENEN